MTSRMFAAALGFAFVAIWIAWNFGWAILCLVGAVVFAIGAYLLEQAGFQLFDLVDRVRDRGSDRSSSSRTGGGRVR